MKCLMIETKDRRKFFTHEKNFPMLIDFAKTFAAEISIVKLEEGQVLELAELAPALCDAGYQRSKSSYEVVEKKIFTKIIARSNILKTADKIQKYIREKLQLGNTISLSDLKSKFKKYQLSTACFCNHIRRTIEELDKNGIKVAKLGAGKYKIPQ